MGHDDRRVLLCGLVLAACVSGLCAAPPERPADPLPPISAEDAADLVYVETAKDKAKLVALGERLFPAFEELLDNPKTPHKVVSRVLNALRDLKGDRSRFLDRAVARLTDENMIVKLSAVEFLRVAGGSEEVAPVAIMLLDRYAEVRYAAAKAVADIGGKGELAVFDSVLKDPARLYQDGKLITTTHYLEHLQKCRDTLEARVKEKKQEREKAEKKDEPKK